MIHRDADDTCIRKAATHGRFFRKTWLILRLTNWPGDPKRCWRHLHQKSRDTRLIFQKDVTYLKTSILTWWSTEILTTLASEKPRHTADSSLVGRNSSPRIKLVITYGTVHNVLCSKKVHQFIYEVCFIVNKSFLRKAMLRYHTVPDISSDKVKEKGVNTTFELTVFNGQCPVYDENCEL